MLNIIKSIVAIFTTAFSTVAPVAPAPDVKSMEGKPLPRFEMKTIEGKTVDNSTIAGKPVIIDFWATWCGPCKKVSPVMQELHKKYSKQGLVVIGANGFEEKTGAKLAKDYSLDNGYRYTFTHGNDGLMKSWGINAVPTIVFVNRAGQVTKVQVGYADRLKSKVLAEAASIIGK